jgi:hypothetical protein
VIFSITNLDAFHELQFTSRCFKPPPPQQHRSERRYKNNWEDPLEPQILQQLGYRST